MGTYVVEALDRSMARVQRKVDAEDEIAARSALEIEGLVPISFALQEQSSVLSRDVHLRSRRPKAADLSQLASDLATRLGAGIDIRKSLERLAEQRSGTPLGDALSDVVQRLRTSSDVDLPESIRAHEDVFGHLFCAMFAAGYQSGNLPEQMDQAAELLADRDEATRKVFAALTQPLMLMIFAVIVTVGMVALVLPVYKTLFAGFGAKLPLPTRMLLDVYHPVMHYWYLTLALIIAAIAGGRIAVSKEPIRLKVDGWMLKFPKVGGLVSKSAMYRMSSTLLGMLAAHVDLFESLALSADTAGNLVYRDALLRVSEMMREDAVSLDVAVRRVGMFPSLFVDAVENGATSGELVATLRKYVKRTGIELKTETERFQQTVQPLINLVVMTIVGLVVIALVAPQYQIIGILSKAGS